MNIPRLFVPLHLQAIKAYILVKWGCLLLCRDARGSATPLFYLCTKIGEMCKNAVKKGCKFGVWTKCGQGEK